MDALLIAIRKAETVQQWASDSEYELPIEQNLALGQLFAAIATAEQLKRIADALYTNNQTPIRIADMVAACVRP